MTKECMEFQVELKLKYTFDAEGDVDATIQFNKQLAGVIATLQKECDSDLPEASFKYVLGQV